jgi:hypothetical protein
LLTEFLGFDAYELVLKLFYSIIHRFPQLTPLTFCIYGVRIGSLITVFIAQVIRKVIDTYEADFATGRPPPEAVLSSSAPAVRSSPAMKSSLYRVYSQYPLGRPHNRRNPVRSGRHDCVYLLSQRLVSSVQQLCGMSFSGEYAAAKRYGPGLLLAGIRLHHRLESNQAGMLLSLLKAVFISNPLLQPNPSQSPHIINRD